MEEGSGCEQCRTWEEEMYWKHFNNMHFYQILPKDFHDHLVLPVKFSGNMTNKLPNKLSLTGPSGTMWDVELKKTNKMISLVGEGWKEFVKACDLEVNCLLVFKFTRNFGFEVLVFEPRTFCEKEAAYFIKKCGHATDHENGKKRKKRVREDFSTEVVEDGGDNDNDNDSELEVSKKARNDAEKPVCDKHTNRPETPGKLSSKVATKGKRGCRAKGRPRKQKLPSDLKAQPENKEKGNEAAEGQSTPEIGGSSLENGNSHKSNETGGQPKKRATPKTSRKLLFPSAKKSPSEYVSNRRSVTEEEKRKELEGAMKGQNEKSFITVMRPTMVYKRFYLNIPYQWMNKHLPHRNQEVILRIGDKTWLTMFYYSGKKGGGITSAGWKKFALENSLEEFDVCLFTLASQNDDPAIVFDVEIFRVIPETVPPSPVATSTLA